MNDKDSGVAIKYCSDGIYIKKDDMKRILLDKFFTKDQKNVAIDLICEKQTKMIIENKDNYDSDEYKELETIKVKIKNMWDLWGVIIMADIIKCSSESCPMKKTCYRTTAKNDKLQSWSNFEYTCNEETGFDSYIVDEK